MGFRQPSRILATPGSLALRSRHGSTGAVDTEDADVKPPKLTTVVELAEVLQSTGPTLDIQLAKLDQVVKELSRLKTQQHTRDVRGLPSA